jgi:hypothetical protein
LIVVLTGYFLVILQGYSTLYDTKINVLRLL